MNCRKNWNKTQANTDKTSAQRDEVMYQAKVCESARSFAWAAILWRRIGMIEEAEQCEQILSAVAGNKNINLLG